MLIFKLFTVPIQFKIVITSGNFIGLELVGEQFISVSFEVLHCKIRDSLRGSFLCNLLSSLNCSCYYILLHFVNLDP